MTEHLPECRVIALLIKGNTVAAGSCICPELRACEERMLSGDERWIKASTEANHRIAYRLGHAAGLDAAREAVAVLPKGGMGQKAHELWRDALTAIDALKEDNHG